MARKSSNPSRAENAAGAKELIVRSLRVYGTNFFLLLPYLLVFSAPVELLDNYPPGESGLPKALYALLSAVLTLAANAVLLPSVFYALLHALENRRIPRFRECLGWGSGRSGRLFRWSAVYWLRVLAWSMVLVAPGLVVFIRYGLFSVVAILEKECENPMGRAREILQGRFRPFSTATAVLLFLPLGVSTAVELALRYRLHLEGHWVLYSLIDILTDLVIFPYSIMTLLAYRDWALRGKGASFREGR